MGLDYQSSWSSLSVSPLCMGCWKDFQVWWCYFKLGSMYFWALDIWWLVEHTSCMYFYVYASIHFYNTNCLVKTSAQCKAYICDCVCWQITSVIIWHCKRLPINCTSHKPAWSYLQWRRHWWRANCWVGNNCETRKFVTTWLTWIILVRSLKTLLKMANQASLITRTLSGMSHFWGLWRNALSYPRPANCIDVLMR